MKRVITVLKVFFVLQLSIFIIFSYYQYIAPANNWLVAKRFNLYWFITLLFAAISLQGIIYIIPFLPTAFFDLELTLLNVMIGYLFYSFLNYWVHRLKHSNSFLWLYFHKLHHSSSQMEAKIAFYRHPTEVVFNGIVILMLSWFFGLSGYFICAVLTIEGTLECYHHSNIKTPKQLKWLSYIIQIPEMHLAHHEYAVHKYNYSPVAFWDLLFGTRVLMPTPSKLGFRDSSSPLKHLRLENS